MRRLTILVISLILVLSTVSVTIAAPPDPGIGNTNFTVQNLDAIQSARVRAIYVSPTGEEAVSRSKTISAWGSDGFPISESGLPDNWIGSVVVSADKKMVAFAQMLWDGGSPGDGTVADGKTAGAYNGFGVGSSRLYLPSLASRDPQFSRISVQSAAPPTLSEEVSFSIKFYNRNGQLDHTIEDTIPNGAQESYSLSPADMPELGGNWLGSAVIEATDNVSPLSAVATMHWRLYAAAYSAVPEGSTKIYLPSATRRVPSGDTLLLEAWLQYTGVVVQNLDRAAIATVTVTWYDRLGNKLHQFVDSIPANSAHGYNTRFVDESQVPEASKNTLPAALGDNWNGSVVIESNGPEIIAVANLQWTESHPAKAAASAYTSGVGGSAVVSLPATFRRIDSSNWLQYTGAIVQNIGATPCDEFEVNWYIRGQAEPVLTYYDSLDPRISHGYNTRFGSAGSDVPEGVDVTQLTNDFRGSMIINGPGCELLAIHNTVWPAWTDSTTYNGLGW
jgi:hypothetical protein